MRFTTERILGNATGLSQEELGFITFVIERLSKHDTARDAKFEYSIEGTVLHHVSENTVYFAKFTLPNSEEIDEAFGETDMFAYLNHWLPILVKNPFSNSNDEVAGEPEKDDKSCSGDDLSDGKETSASEHSDKEIFTERKAETSSSKGHM